MLKRRVLSALLAAAALTLSPAGAWAEAMSDKQFVSLCREGTAEQVKQALKDGANPNAKDEHGKPALMYAVWNDNKANGAEDERALPVIRALLDAGADVNARDKNGETPLILAAQTLPDGVVTALLAAGADVNIQDKIGQTALMRAAGQSLVDKIRALLAAGADPTLKDMWGHDALHHAEESITQEDIGVDGYEGMDEKVWQESIRLIEEAVKKHGSAKKPAAKKKRKKAQ